MKKNMIITVSAIIGVWLIILTSLLIIMPKKTKQDCLLLSDRPEKEITLKGAVNIPGTYKVNVGDPLSKAISFAQGLKDNANTQKINPEYQIKASDREFFIPEIKKDEKPLQNIKKLDLNRASYDMMKNIKILRDKDIHAILDYRKSNRFYKVEDLLNIKGIGQKTFNKIKIYFRV